MTIIYLTCIINNKMEEVANKPQSQTIKKVFLYSKDSLDASGLGFYHNRLNKIMNFLFLYFFFSPFLVGVIYFTAFNTPFLNRILMLAFFPYLFSWLFSIVYACYLAFKATLIFTWSEQTCFILDDKDNLWFIRLGYINNKPPSDKAMKASSLFDFAQIYNLEIIGEMDDKEKYIEKVKGSFAEYLSIWEKARADSAANKGSWLRGNFSGSEVMWDYRAVIARLDNIKLYKQGKFYSFYKFKNCFGKFSRLKLLVKAFPGLSETIDTIKPAQNSDTFPKNTKLISHRMVWSASIMFIVIIFFSLVIILSKFKN